MSKKVKKITEFKLGITMAGAVTAGAYSAGCLYYLLRNLEKWEQLKKEGCKSIPNHKVTIEVMGGSSAGSMVTAIAALTFGLESNFTDLQDMDEGNLLYDSWVNLLDDRNKGGTLMELLKANKKSSKIPEKFSLFNSAFLTDLRDKIVDKIVKANRREEWPVYISENLQILFTLTSLDGIPVGVSFSKDHPESLESPVHYMKSHRVISHHIRETSGKDTTPLLNFPSVYKTSKAIPSSGSDGSESDQIKKEMQKFVDFALASGAFPIGFPPVNLRISGGLLRHYLRDYFFKDYEKKLVLGKVAKAPKFDFAAIDGGTLNNEPFVEVKSILDKIIGFTEQSNTITTKKQKVLSQFKREYKTELEENQNTKNLFNSINLEDTKRKSQVFDAIIMIDPFPNFNDIDIDSTTSNSPKDIIFNIIGALHDQAMMKNPERILDFINGERFGMIFPSRRVDGELITNEPHLATSGVGAFGGFLSKEFRRHDFILGMKNCQSFIRRYFGINADSKDKYDSFEDWNISDERYKRFAFKDTRNIDDGIVRFPIIPDMALEHPKNQQNNEIRFEQSAIASIEFPKIKPEDVTKYSKPLRRRLLYLGKRWLFSPSKSKITDSDNEVSFIKPLETAKWLRKAAIIFLLLVMLGYLYWLLPIGSFWLILIVPLLFIVLAAYLVFRNAISTVFASLLKQLSYRNQIDSRNG